MKGELGTENGNKRNSEWPGRLGKGRWVNGGTRMSESVSAHWRGRGSGKGGQQWGEWLKI